MENARLTTRHACLFPSARLVFRDAAINPVRFSPICFHHATVNAITRRRSRMRLASRLVCLTIALASRSGISSCSRLVFPVDRYPRPTMSGLVIIASMSDCIAMRSNKSKLDHANIQVAVARAPRSAAFQRMYTSLILLDVISGLRAMWRCSAAVSICSVLYAS